MLGTMSGIRPTDKEELNGEWAPVCPPITASTKALDGCVGQQLTDHNAQIDTCRSDTAKNNWRDLFKALVDGLVSWSRQRFLNSPQKSTEVRWLGRIPVQHPRSTCLSKKQPLQSKKVLQRCLRTRSQHQRLGLVFCQTDRQKYCR